MRIIRSLKKIYLHLTEFKWTIGLMDYDENFVLRPSIKPKVRWIKYNYKEGWFADPFILSISRDRVELLAEHYVYANHRAHISKLIVEKDSNTLVEISPVLDEQSHMSFPAYFRENGKVYIYPENVHSGELSLYEYDEKTDSCSFVKTISNYPLADAVVVTLGKNKLILGTRFPHDNGKVLEIHPYVSKEDSGKEIVFVEFNNKIARNAGLPFRIGDKLIRPAQCSDSFYGECLVFQEMKQSDSGDLSFDEIKRVYSPNRKYPLSFHTFNVFNNRLVSVDAQGFRYGWLGLILFRIRELLRK